MSRKTQPAFVPDASQRRRPVRVRSRRITASFAKLYPPDGEGKIWWGRLKKALGTGSSDFVNASLHQLQAAGSIAWQRDFRDWYQRCARDDRRFCAPE